MERTAESWGGRRQNGTLGRRRGENEKREVLMKLLRTVKEEARWIIERTGVGKVCVA